MKPVIEHSCAVIDFAHETQAYLTCAHLWTTSIASVPLRESQKDIRDGQGSRIGSVKVGAGVKGTGRKLQQLVENASAGLMQLHLRAWSLEPPGQTFSCHPNPFAGGDY